MPRLIERFGDVVAHPILGGLHRRYARILDFGSDSVVIQEVTESDIKEMRATLAAKGNWFRSVAGADHRRLEWQPILGFPTDAPVREGRSVDLIVIGHTMGAGDAYGSLDQGGLLLKIGRPTLVVPEGVAMRRA